MSAIFIIIFNIIFFPELSRFCLWLPDVLLFISSHCVILLPVSLLSTPALQLPLWPLPPFCVFSFSSPSRFQYFFCTPPAPHPLINGVCVQSWCSFLSLSVRPVLRLCYPCVIQCVFHLSLFTPVPSGVLQYLPVSPHVACFCFFLLGCTLVFLVGTLS